MIVRDISIEYVAEACVLSAMVDFGAQHRNTRRIWYRLSRDMQPLISGIGNPFLAAMLPLAMAAGEDLTVKAPISRRLADNLEKIMDIYHCWDQKWQKIHVSVSDHVTEIPAGIVSGSFFTLGVDSFYTLLKKGTPDGGSDRRIDSLVYVDGFDIKLEDRKLAEEVHRHIEEVAGSLCKKTVFVRTNLREFSDSFMDWGFYHGAALASVGLVLAGYFNKLLIPATATYRVLYPCGSHPVLDPLWSIETLEFIHEGAEATRLAKIRRIADSDLVRRNLRVCWKNPGGAYNCGECPKCLRTMVGLYLAGSLEKTPVFPPTIPLDKLDRVMLISGDNTFDYTVELRDALQQQEPGTLLTRAVEKQVLHYQGRTDSRKTPLKKRLRKLERLFKRWRIKLHR